MRRSPIFPSRSLKDKIEAAIIAGKFKAGDHLDEVRLAEDYGVSRTPVRQALHQLAIMGLIEIRPHRGAFVRALNTRHIYEIFEVLSELEAMAGRIAARKLTHAKQYELDQLYQTCQPLILEPNALLQGFEAFHQAIWRASGNEFLFQQCATLYKRLNPFMRLLLTMPHRAREALNEREAILRALRNGDGEGAARALKASIRVEGPKFSDLVASLPH